MSLRFPQDPAELRPQPTSLGPAGNNRAEASTETDGFEDLTEASRNPVSSPKLLVQHVATLNLEEANRSIETLFLVNPNLKLKEVVAELRKLPGATGQRLAEQIEAKTNGTGPILSTVGRLTRSVTSKTPQKRAQILKEASKELIEQLQAEQQHPAARTVAVRLSRSTRDFNTPEIKQTQTLLFQKREKLKANSEHSARLKESLQISQRESAEQESELVTLEQRKVNAQKAINRFESIKNMTPAQRSQELDAAQKAGDKAWEEALNSYAPRLIASHPKAKEALEFLKNQAKDSRKKKIASEQYIHWTQVERNDLPKNENNAKRIELLEKAIASVKYELSLHDDFLTIEKEHRSVLKTLEPIRAQHLEQQKLIEDLERSSKQLAQEVKDLTQKLNWQGYQSRAKAIQDLNRSIFEFTQEQVKLQKELEQDKENSKLSPLTKKQKIDRLTEIETQLKTHHQDFRVILFELEQFDLDVYQAYDREYPKDGKPYPNDPGYSTDEIARFATFDPVNNPLFTGGKNRRPPIQELVKDYQLARQGITLTDAYQKLWERSKSAGVELPKELAQYDQGKQTQLEKLLTLSTLLGRNQQTNDTMEAIRVLISDYPLETIGLFSNLSHAYSIFNRNLHVAGAGEGTVSRIMQEYRGIAQTRAVQAVASDVLAGLESTSYSESQLRPMDPATLAFIHFSQYLPYLAATLVPSTGSALASQTGVRLLAETGAATYLGLMSKTQAAGLIAVDWAASLVPESLRSIASTAKGIVGIYTQVRGEQLAMEQLEHAARVKNSAIVLALDRMGGHEDGLRQALFYGYSKENVRRIGGVLRAALKSNGSTGAAIQAAMGEWGIAWKQNPKPKALKTAVALGAGVLATAATGGTAPGVFLGAGVFATINKAANAAHDGIRGPQSQKQKEQRQTENKKQQLRAAYEQLRQANQNAGSIAGDMPDFSDSDWQELASVSDDKLEEALQQKVEQKNQTRKALIAAQAGTSPEEVAAFEQQQFALQKE